MIDQPISEETAKSLVLEIKKQVIVTQALESTNRVLSTEMAKFNNLFGHIDKVRQTKKEAQQLAVKASEAFKKTFKRE